VKQRAVAYLQRFGRLTTTAITVFERLRGYQLAIRRGKPFEKQLQAFEALAAACVVLPFDDEAAAVAARIWCAVSRARRQHIGDISIAAIAVSRQLPLVIRNRRDFEQLAASAELELRLIDWSASGR
jgi:predicted nucleic acid-binding protein